MDGSVLYYLRRERPGGQALGSLSWHRALIPALNTAGTWTRLPRSLFKAGWATFSPPGCVAPRTGVGGAHETFAVGASRHDLRYAHRRHLLQLVASPRQASLQLAGQGFLDHQLVWEPLVMDPRTGNRFLRAHPEVKQAHQFEHHLRNDLRSARCAEGDERLAVFEHQRGGHAGQWWLAGRDRAGLVAN